MFSKPRVGVLRGGPGSEYAISLETGAAALAHLSEAYHAHDIFIDRSGDWHLHGRKESPHIILRKVDAIINALHGEYGEDGQVQEILETHRIAFSGSGRLASALAQNKPLTKRLMAREGIKVPHGQVLLRENAGDLKAVAAMFYRTFPQPSVIKPASRGSSIGVSIARTPEELAYALALAFGIDETVLIEEQITGTEIVTGVIEDFRGESLYTLLPLEVRLPNGSPFFDYSAKQGGEVKFLAAQSIGETERNELQTLAAKVHRILGLRHYSSSGFIVHPKRGIYFLEVDSLPSLSPYAPFVASLAAVGCPLPHFLDHLVSLAFRRK